MKPIKSLALLGALVMAFGACSKKAETVQTRSPIEKPASTTNAYPAVAPAEPATAVAPVVVPVPARRTTQGSGAASRIQAQDEAADDHLRDDEYFDEAEATFTDQGTGATIDEDEMEYVDETASEPNNVRGGRDARLLHKQNKIDNTASEPDNIHQ